MMLRYSTFVGITLAMTGAASTALANTEKLAESAWKLRAALNVAALQCQFDPGLKTVSNYNEINKLHKAELEKTRAIMEGKYRRLHGRGGNSAFDRYNTKIWNGFSSVNYQVPFCTKAAEIGKAALETPAGGFTALAESRLPEVMAVFPAPEPAVKPAAKKPAKKSARKKSAKKKRR